MTKLNNHSGFSVVEALLMLLIVGILGFVGWFVYHSQKVADKSYNAQSSAGQATTTADNAKTEAMASWSTFNNETIGLTFKYPSDWGQAKFEVMHANPDESNPTFYKVSFDKRIYTYITVKPKAALKDFDSATFNDFKTSVTAYPDRTHIFVSSKTVVGAIVPSVGNQDAEVSAARAIDLLKVDATYVQLFDAKKFDTTCTQTSYASACYATDELYDYQWLLESATSL